MEFVDDMTELFYRVLTKNRGQILSYLRNPKIIGKNPQGETTRYFDKAIEQLLVAVSYTHLTLPTTERV